MTQELWQERKVLARALGVELASAGFYLEDETTQQPPHSLSLTINLRVVGVQIGSTRIAPLANTPFQIDLAQPIGGNVKGRIDDLRAIDRNGQPAPDWQRAAAVGFRVTALGDLTLSAQEIASLIPVVGPILRIALGRFGNNVTVTVAHDDIVAHMPRTLAPAA